MPEQPEGEVVIPLYREEVEVSREVKETGRVAVTRVTREDPVLINEELTRETAEITRQEINRYVETMPAIREEGDTLIVPVVEERLVLQRRLFLKAEVRVRRVRSSQPYQETVMLRHHEVVVKKMQNG